jgi:hypothetical protein
VCIFKYDPVEQKLISVSLLQLEGSTSGGGSLVLKVVAFKQALEEAVVEAFAQALAGAHKYQETQGCVAFVNTNGCIWTPEQSDPEFCFECEASAVSVGVIQEIDAIAEASALPKRMILQTFE